MKIEMTQRNMLPDLTEIKTPFGLLDRETQEALISHGGPYEWWHGVGFHEAASAPAWDPHFVYRVKPAPPKPREWWAVQKGVVHIGLWNSERHAVDAAKDYRGAEIIHVREVLE